MAIGSFCTQISLTVKITRFSTSVYKWEVLLIGGLVTVVFSCFFVLESLWMQAAMTALMSLVIAFNLYVVVELSNPFLGRVMVAKTPFLVITTQIANETI